MRGMHRFQSNMTLLNNGYCLLALIFFALPYINAGSSFNGPTLVGLLTCNAQNILLQNRMKNKMMHQIMQIKVFLYSPIYKGKEAVLWRIQSNNDFIVKIPRRANEVNPWLHEHVDYTPPNTKSIFLNQYVPPSIKCQLTTDLWTKTRQVLLRRYVKGFDLETLPQKTVGSTINQIHKELSIFMIKLAKYERKNEISLFDVNPKNLMYGELLDKSDNQYVLLNLFKNYSSSSTNSSTNSSNNSSNNSSDNKNAHKIWLVDFTVRKNKFSQADDFKRNDRSNKYWWNKIKWTKKLDGGGAYYQQLFAYYKANINKGRFKQQII